MSEFVKIIALEPAGPHSLSVTFSTGETRQVDFAEQIARGGIWAALADPALFAQAMIDEYERGIEWPNGADSCADALYARSTKPLPVASQ